MRKPGIFDRAPFDWARRALETLADPTSVPPGEVVYAIGDIHGRADLLDDLLDRILRDAADHPDDRSRRAVFLGDYIDRGTASRAVIERLLGSPLPGFATVHLKGNHEQAMLDFLEGRTDGEAWLAYGGAATVMSYGVSISGQSNVALRRELADALPVRHLDFFRTCYLHHTAGDYLFVHAGVRPGVSLEVQDPFDVLWIREDFLKVARALPNKVVVHGHTVCRKPENRAHRINVDTGAFITDRLTCVVLRGNRRRFLTTGK